MDARFVSRGAVILAVIIWGTTFIPSKMALREVGPFTLAFVRFLLAFFVLLPFLWRTLRAHRAAVPWGRLALMGFMGVTCYFGLQNVGLLLTAAVNAGVVLACLPALTAVLSSLLLGEHLSLARLLGVLLSMIGVGVMIIGQAQSAEISISWQGDLLVLGSALVWATYTVMSKKASLQIPDSLVTLGTIGFGMLFLFPLTFMEGGVQRIQALQPQTWLAIAFLALGASAVAYFLWNYGLRCLDATECGAYLNLMPGITAAAAALFLGEPITLWQVSGGAIILTGVLLAGRQRSSTR